MTAARSHQIEAAGVRLHVEEAGRGSPVVLLHGFTGSSRALASIAAGLSDRHTTLSFDLVGHGRSEAPRSAAAYSMSACVDQLACALDQLGVGAAHWLGYSMGGRVALAFAVAHPARVRSALLVGASAGILDAEQRASRVRADCALAERIERAGVAAFVEEWIAQPLLVSEQRIGARGVAEARSMRLSNSAHGLASSLRGMGAGAQPPLHAALPRVGAPICLVAGELDRKFRALAAEVGRALPNARVEIVRGAGHAAHTDDPGAFLEIARSFYATADAREAPRRPGVEHARSGARIP